MRLYSSERMCSAIKVPPLCITGLLTSSQCYDVRNLQGVLFEAPRQARTNQRMYFDLTRHLFNPSARLTHGNRDGKYLFTGQQDGTLIVYNTDAFNATDTVWYVSLRV